MLVGRQISLRPVRRDEVERLHESTMDLESRGPWYPLPGTPLIKFEARFAESGFWAADEGVFTIVDQTDRLVGIVGWELLSGDLPDVEISYRLLDRDDHGKGITTEAVGLLTGWLFDTGHMNRLRANVHVDNTASRRVVEKSGFTQEATARASWYSRGRWHDVAVDDHARRVRGETRCGWLNRLSRGGGGQGCDAAEDQHDADDLSP